MMDMNKKAQSYLTQHKYQKRKTICTALLSVLMVFCVVSSLIMPAVSMTIDAVQEFVVEQEDVGLKSAPPSDAPNAVDITDGDYDVTVDVDGKNTIFSTDSSIQTNPSYEITGKETDISFELSYTLSNVMDTVNSITSGAHLYMYIDKLTECVSFNAQQANGNVTDAAYNALAPAGTYEIKDGYVKITLTDNYKSWVNQQTGKNLKGTLKFSGTISRDDTEIGDQTLNIGGQNIQVQFKDQKPYLSSKSGDLNKENGTITWTVVIDNSYNIDLHSYNFSDTMLGDANIQLADGTSVTVTPFDAATVSGKNITFTENAKTASPITITYTTRLTEDQLKANATNTTNTATLKKIDETNESTATGNVWLTDAFKLSKSGSPNYDSRQIDWTITLKNEYGVLLDGYIIEDANFPSDVSGITVTPTGGSLTNTNGNWTLSGVGNAKEVTIKYSTAVSDTNTTTDNSNNVSLNFPTGDSTGDSADATVTYKKEDDLINFNKTVSGYNQDTHEITWSIQVTPEWLANENQYHPLNDYQLIDEAFKSLTLDDLTIRTSSGNVDQSLVTFDQANGTLQFNSNCDIRDVVTITYKTQVAFNEGENKKDAVTVTNPISDSNHHTTTVSTEVKPRNSFSKRLNSTSTGSTASSGDIVRTLEWQAEILWDGKFADLALNDTPGVTINVASGNLPSGVTASHTLDQSSIVVKAKKAAGDSYEEIPLTDNYEVTLTADGFAITFKDGNELDTYGYNYVLVEYKTTATMDPVQGVENAFANGDITYTFKNNGSFNGQVSSGNNYTFTRQNPDVDEKADVTIKKGWVDNSDSTRPSSVTVKLEYKKQVGAVWDVDWHDVKGTQNNYLFYDEAAGANNMAYDNASTFTYELNESNDWTMDLYTLGLPKREAAANTDGTQGAITTYCYRVVEIKADGTQVTDNYFAVDNGSYIASYKKDGSGPYDEGTSSGIMTITNTFYPNIDITAQKYWEGITNPMLPVTVQLQRSTDNKTWTAYAPENGSSTVELTSTNGYTYDGWKNLPVKGVENGKQVTYYYRIVETKFGTTEITADKQHIIVEGGYYEVTQRTSSTGTSSANGSAAVTLSVKNTYYPTENITITAQKQWPSGDDTALDSVTVQLQRKAGSDGDWMPYPDTDNSKTLTADNWSCSWSDLPNQSIAADGTVTKYTYRMVETGVNGITFGTLVNDNRFAVDENGYYEIGYSIYSWGGGADTLTSTGTIYVSNTYHAADTTSITPKKVWVGDGTYATQRNVMLAILRLQRKLGDGDWEDVHGSIQNGVFVVNDSDSLCEVTLSIDNKASWDNSGNTWAGTTISGLPKQVITLNEGGSYTIQEYVYQFVEVVDGTVYTNGEYFKPNFTDSSSNAVDGKYTVTIKGDTVTNTFSEDIGINKRIVNRQGETITEIDKEQLVDFKYTWNGKEYYVFNWILTYEGNTNKIAPIVDELPEGFTLLLNNKTNNPESGIDSSKKEMYWISCNPNNQLMDTTPITAKGAAGKEITEITGNSNRWYYKSGFYELPTMGWIPVTESTQNYSSSGAHVATEKNSGLEVFQSSNSGNFYYYDAENNKVYFNAPNVFDGFTQFTAYATMIECEKLDALVEKGTYTITNDAVKHDISAPYDATDKRAQASLTIKNTQTRGLITKNYSETLIPGYIQYSLDINPEGKNLSTGDTIDISDLFKTNSYTDHDWATSNKVTASATTTGGNLIDVVMNNIRIYQYDANGNETLLPVNQYTILFQSGSKVENGAALLQLTVPDEMHLRVVYSYKLVANEYTPSVLNGCISNTRVNGRYPVMQPGMIPPAGDTIVFSNTATLTSDSASDSSSKNNVAYEIFDSSGTISTNTLPKITKVNTGDYTIDDLNATFLFARYSATEKKWQYATLLDGEGVATWSDAYLADTAVPDANAAEKISTADGPVPVALQEGVLYKLVEISVPGGYEGSNLDLGAEYETLVRNFLNSGETTFGGMDYVDYLTTHKHIHYFAYNSTISSDNLPDGLLASEVMQVRTGGNIEIPNNELVDITVQKQWIDTNGNPEDKDAEITVQLYWSHTKASSGMPEDAKLATAEDLGIVGSSFENTKTITTPQILPSAPLWSNLPNGKNDRPIYYYIKETAYTVGDKTYTLQTSGQYNGQFICTANGSVGAYLPTYSGNATYVSTSDTSGNVQNNVSVTVKNSQQLMLKKVWRNADGDELTGRYIPTDALQVAIYGYDAENIRTTSPLFTTTLWEFAGWQANITALVENLDLSQYKSFEAVETGGGANLDNFVVSCVFNLNQNTGEITVTNRSTQPTEASVTVNKTWSDGADLHTKDSIEVTLYCTTTSDPSNHLDELSADMLIKDYGATFVKDVTLSAENNWTHTWKGLALDNGTEDTNPTEYYYYYAVETGKTLVEADAASKYKASYTATINGGKTTMDITNTRNAIVLQKQWFDEDGYAIVKYNENGQLVDASGNVLDAAEAEALYGNLSATVEVYKQAVQAPAGGLNILALGDSITNGDGNSGAGYWSYLKADLEEAGFTVNGDASTWKYGHSGYAIKSMQSGSMPAGVTYTEYRSGIYDCVDKDFSNKSPDIVLLMAGTNDIISNYRVGITDRLHELIDKVQAVAPNAVIFVAGIPDFNFVGSPSGNVVAQNWFKYYDQTTGDVVSYNSVTYDAAFETMINGFIRDYNSSIQALATQLAAQGEKVRYVDINSVVEKKHLTADGCHPNDDGNKAMAAKWAEEIQNYYTTADPNAFSQSVTLNRTNNWTAAVDLPDDGTYYIQETAPTTGWTVAYKNQTTGETGNTVTVKANQKALIQNTRHVEKTSLTVEKTWANDSGGTNNTRPENLTLTLLRRVSTGENTWSAWEEYLATPTVDKTTDANKWTFTYANLPAKDASGNFYYYKVEESVPSGYSVTYGAHNGPDGDGLIAKPDDSAGTLALTNTLSVSLKLQKEWSDADTVDHTGDSVTVRVYRSTDSSKVPSSDNLTLALPSNASVSVDGSTTVTANKVITGATITSENENIATATLDEDGKTITITGISAGKATITVTATTNGVTETKTIEVTVSELTAQLTVDGNVTNTMTIGQIGTLSAKMGENAATGATFELQSGDGVISLSDDQVTALAAGTAKVKAKYESFETILEITVKYPSFSGNDSIEIEQGGTKNIAPDTLGGFTYEVSPADSKITVDSNGNVSTANASIGDEATVTINRDDSQKTVTIEVVESTELKIYHNGDDITGQTINVLTGVEATFTTSRTIDSIINNNSDYFLTYSYTAGERSFKLEGVRETGWNITVTVTSGDKTASFYVKVNAYTALAITPSSASVIPGGSVTLQSNKDNTTYAVATDANSIIASLTNGTVTIKDTATPGQTATIKATCGDETATVTITVIAPGSGEEFTTNASGQTKSITYDNTKEIEKIIVELDSTHYDWYPFVRLYFDGNQNGNYVKLGYKNSPDISVTESGGNVAYSIVDGKVEITLTNNYKPNSVGIYQDGSTSTSGTVTIVYKDGSTSGDSGSDDDTPTVTLNEVTGSYNSTYNTNNYVISSAKAGDNVTFVIEGTAGTSLSGCYGWNASAWTSTGWNGTIGDDGKLTLTHQVPDDYNNSYQLQLYSWNANENKVSKVSYAISPLSTASYTPNTYTSAAFLLAEESPQLYSAGEATSSITWTDVGDGTWYTEITIDAVPNVGTDAWTYILSGLDVFDSSGNAYYYWAEENPVTGYTPLYTYISGGVENAAINASAIDANTQITITNHKTTPSPPDGYILPSTGGQGRALYTATGLTLMVVSAAGAIIIRRRRKAVV